MKESFERIDKLASELHAKKHETSEGGAYILLAMPKAHSEKMVDAMCGHPMEVLNLLSVSMATDPKFRQMAELAMQMSDVILRSKE